MHKNTARSRAGAAGAIAFFCALAGLACVAQAQPSGKGGGSGAALPVITAPVLRESFADRVEALGTTKANETVAITANVTEGVSEILFEDGQQVKKGDILLTLEKNEEAAELKAAQALLDERKASYKRAQNLEKQQALSTATLEERQALLRQIEGNIEAIRSRIDDRIVKAPFDGMLGLRQVSPGTLVKPGDVITTIDDLGRIKVDFDVPSVFLNNLRAGLPIEGRVEAFGDQVFEGVVSTVGTQVDPVTRTVTVRAVLPNPEMLLKPGLLMSVILFKNPRQALMIPEEALIQKEDKFFVFVVAQKNGQSVAAQKFIAIGSRLPGDVEVTQGLAQGDQVIIHGNMNLRDGQPVSIRAVKDDNQSLDELLKTGPDPQ